MMFDRQPIAYSVPSGLSPVRLTRRQVETLSAIERLTRECGYPPSGSEISEALKPSPSQQAIHYSLKALRGKGLVISTYGVHRSIRLTADGRQLLEAALAALAAPAANSDQEVAAAV